MTRSGPLQTLVRYVDGRGEIVDSTLKVVDAACVLTGSPVRRVRSHAKQRHYSGLFWSATTGAHVVYESRLELDRLLLADFDPSITGIAAQPVWLSGRDGDEVRRHAPDLLLRDVDGEYTLIDVKPAPFAERPAVAAVFGWTARLCAAKGWRYEVWTGGDPAKLANVRFLAAGRRRDLIDDAALASLSATAADGITIGEVLANAHGVCRGDLLRGVLALLWSGTWTTELTTPISLGSVLSVAEVAT